MDEGIAPAKQQDGLRARLRVWTETPRFRYTILVIIFLNAITLGMETSPSIMAAIGPELGEARRRVGILGALATAGYLVLALPPLPRVLPPAAPNAARQKS